ncbi:MAG: bshC [Ferruginibacter sp.]|nr:bshC [Ferruginibacter sp.]
MTRFTSQHIPYAQTNAFSAIVNDYLDRSPELQPFYAFAPTMEGIGEAIGARKSTTTDRNSLVDHLTAQYSNINPGEAVNRNIRSLLSENTFTVCTAHQPNIFTGHLYFVYKILHAIKLANELNAKRPAEHFVPVYYMGSEDADLEELGEVQILGKKYQWQTKQTGAVGRMLIDKAFLSILDGIESQLAVEPFGKELIQQLRNAYRLGISIEQATFRFVHELFADYGLIVLLPDAAALKKTFSPVIEKELDEQFSYAIVQETVSRFPQKYKVQAAGRELNLFYLKDDLRARISVTATGFDVLETGISFSKEDMRRELADHPERFSPNVILRPLFQEMILPNVAFIGGGGELAYWLELKDLFEAANIPFPVLLLRNSFLLVEEKVAVLMAKLGFAPADFFRPSIELMETLVKKHSTLPLSLSAELETIGQIYRQVEQAASAIDPTLSKHVAALETQHLQRIQLLEKKMMRAEKRKFAAEERQLAKLRAALFPGGILQERTDNLLPYYARYGKQIIADLYDNSAATEAAFCIITGKEVTSGNS